MPKKKRRKTYGHPYLQDINVRHDANRVPEAAPEWIVPPDNPPGFGTVRPELLYQSPLLTGQILFDDPFYTVPPPPPYGPQDPTWPAYQKVLEAAERRNELCQPGQETDACRASRLDYFEIMRQYAVALDKHWGLNRFQPDTGASTKPTDQSANEASTRRRSLPDFGHM